MAGNEGQSSSGGQSCFSRASGSLGTRPTRTNAVARCYSTRGASCRRDATIRRHPSSDPHAFQGCPFASGCHARGNCVTAGPVNRADGGARTRSETETIAGFAARAHPGQSILSTRSCRWRLAEATSQSGVGIRSQCTNKQESNALTEISALRIEPPPLTQETLAHLRAEGYLRRSEQTPGQSPR